MSHDLSATGRVLLGMLCLGKRTGYEIKQLVDKSTRFFWAASYGQIYPEFKRLEEQGLVVGRNEPSGARARTVYELTDAGQQALREWLQSDVEPLYELRDEGMLKLFFSDALPERRVANIRAMRERFEHKLAALQSIQPPADAPLGTRLTLGLGIGMTEWLIDWCQRTEQELSDA
ncbi:MAG TPA: PadR family transcriptional regulator [Solirubrobacteraceae bacterium]|nr:PadR family transcriptional regulator [Solirubrobacteraceae bacterium]